jgi:hypothetical protein
MAIDKLTRRKAPELFGALPLGINTGLGRLDSEDATGADALRNIFLLPGC